jgi:hypothetical protein
MRVGGQRHGPAAVPPGKTRYPLYRRLGGPQGRSGLVRKISSPPGFDYRTVQPVASRYTGCAMPAPRPTDRIVSKCARNVSIQGWT